MNTGRIITTENRKTGIKSCTNATLSTINPTCTALGLNLGLRDNNIPNIGI
jgi:hypothetical protein